MQANSDPISNLATATSDLDYASKLQGIMKKDELMDGEFVFAVRSTRIYCNPSCPSRRPSKSLIEFYSTPADAERQGYRPCMRCKPRDVQNSRQSQLVKEVCDYVDKNLRNRLTLQTIGTEFKISPFHLHRTFKRVTGMTLHDYIQARKLAVLKLELQRGEPVTRAAYRAGFSSRSRLYNKIQDKLGMQPGDYRRGGDGLKISYTIINSPFGRILIAATPHGVCSVCLGESDQYVETSLINEFPSAEIKRDDNKLSDVANAFYEYFDKRRFIRTIKLDVRATPFQRRVWNQLRSVPAGSTRSYDEIAKLLGSPHASRAVANACASNPTTLLIPCHRVIRKSGQLGGYRWGLERKQALLRYEHATKQNSV